MNVVSPAIDEWLRAFSKAVRDRDFIAGGKLFDADVVAFGTVGNMLFGLDQLRKEQWQIVWSKTTGFDFDYKTAAVTRAENLAFVMSEWSSTGYHQDKTPFPRRGRATIILRCHESHWHAVHTHFSFSPASFHDPLLHH